MKKIAFLSFLTAFSGIAFTAQAGEPTPVTPETMELSGAGTVKKVGDDYVLSFTDTANTYALTLPDGVKSIRYLVVAGGGAGGNFYDGAAGGGGAGGMLTGEGITVETGNVLTIKVGAGGDGTTKKDGDASSLTLGSTVIACADGGGGGGVNGAAPNPGGSGGGGNGAGSNGRKIYAGADAKSASDGRKQGNAGGGVAYDTKTNIGGGGGGGANGETDIGKGGDGSLASGGKGGDGSPCDITGEDGKYYAGGGGGAARNSYNPGGSGGKGGGGAGAGTSPAGNGEDGTGSGGGGGASGNTQGGKGGDGIVIIRYTMSSTTAKATVHFSHESNTATWVATTKYGETVENDAEIDDGATITVVATPKDDYEYASAPEGWTKNANGTITMDFKAKAPECTIPIPAAVKIDYVPVQFTSNGSAFFEATNAAGEAIGERVRAGTEVFVKIWAGVGFVYNETPPGWTLEAEGGAYTKTFTAVSGSTLAIQIPNAEEIGGTSTKTIDEQDGYMVEANDVFIVVFTNVTHQHTFILPDGVQSIRYLVVGGGGAGGGRRGGGGGAGGMLTDDEFKVVGRTLKINVGQGGEGVNKAVAGTSGGDSKLENGIVSIVAYGGGGGGAGNTSSAVEGGSGGGGGGTTGDQSTPLPGAPAKDTLPLQGNAGGTSSAYMSACGGGGAGEPGKAGTTNAGGAGGAGRICDITGEDNKYYAAGGGGASRNSSSSGGVGGSGIGGNGGKNADGLKAGLPGKDGTGSGGGGAAGDTDDYSGKGGDGVVIISYLAGGKQQLRLEENSLGTITASPAVDGGVYEKNAEVTLTAVPKKEYLFSEWTINGEKVGNENPLVITMDSDKVVGASYTLNPDYYGVKRAETEDRPARVLIIGNSFSSWLGRNKEPGLGPIVRKLGRKVDVTALYYGACSLEQHWANRDKVFYQIIRSSFDSAENPFAPYNETKGLTLTQVLEMYDWDVITIQQASAHSYQAGSYEPYLGNLLGYIREKAPFAEVKFHETWSYSRYDPNNCFGDVAKRDEMYDGILNAVNEKVVPYGLDIIPTGYAVQLWRYRNNIYLRDTDITSDADHHHFKENGEYLGAYAFCKRIFGEVPDEAKATVGGNDILSCAVDAANATDLSYYGQGTINFSWEVTFKDNSGVFADDTQSITNRACATAPVWTREGFVLTGWLDESETLYTSEAVGSRPVVDDITYTAKWTPTFGKMTVMLNTTVSEATGFAPALGEYTYNEGDQVSFTAPTTTFLFNGGHSRGSVVGYRIDTKDEGGEWVLGEEKSGNSAEYTQGNDFTVERRFVWLLGDLEHQLVITQPEHGSITGTEGWYSEGAAVTIAAVATKPYEFLYWTGDAAGIESPLTIMMNGPKTISANISRSPLVRPENGYTIESIPNEMVVVFTNVNQQIDFKVPNGVSSIRYLVVAGGGSGGNRVGGGGGAGGMLENSAYSVNGGDILKINVGAGGASVKNSSTYQRGENGRDSSIFNGTVQIALAYGGGAGGARDVAPTSGGSGGGGGGFSYNNNISYNLPAGASPTDSNQGNAGGGVNDTTVVACGSGGGGAGEGEVGKGTSGTVGPNASPGAGGDGRECDITGEKICYAGGGGGGHRLEGSGGAAGGQGGGGHGGSYDGSTSGQDGTDGLGGGGGGSGAGTDGQYHSGKGGNGVVILRFVKPKSGPVFFIM